MGSDSAGTEKSGASNPSTRVLFGRVLPERVAVTLVGLPTILVKAGGHADTELDIHVDASCVVVNAVGGTSIDDATLKEMVRASVASFVDCLGFVAGCGYQVEITSVGGDRATVFGVKFGDSEPDGTVHEKTDSLIGTMLSRSDGSLMPLQRALADYRRAILEAADSPFHAFRAVEALSYYFGRNPRRGMQELCSALNISQAWIQKNLEIPAGEIRHGKARDVELEERRLALDCARVSIWRFVEFVRRAENLKEPEFPEL